MALLPTLWEQTVAPIRASRRLTIRSGSRVPVRPQLKDPPQSDHTCSCVCVGIRMGRRGSSHSCIKAIRQGSRYLVHEIGVRDIRSRCREGQKASINADARLARITYDTTLFLYASRGHFGSLMTTQENVFYPQSIRSFIRLR